MRVLLADGTGAFVREHRPTSALAIPEPGNVSPPHDDLLVFASNFLVAIAQALNSLRYFHELLQHNKVSHP